MKVKRTGKIKLTAGLLALTLLTGTFAFFSKEVRIDNPFATKEYGGEMIEKFTPENEWEPGAQVEKVVQAKNTGDYPLFVRIKFEEKWERDGNAIANTAFTSEDEKFFPADADTGVGPAITTGSSVYKHLVNVGDPGSGKSWIKQSDGYYYYAKALKPSQQASDSTGTMTVPLMDYVTLCRDAYMGEYETSEILYAVVDQTVEAKDIPDSAYEKSADGKIPEIPEGKVLYQKKVVALDQEESKKGLAKAEYTLTIITEFLQADTEAADAANWTYIPTLE